LLLVEMVSYLTNTKFNKQGPAPQLSEIIWRLIMWTAQGLVQFIIEQLGEDYESPSQISDALEDGVFLELIDASQNVVEEAHEIAKSMA
jgi:hypothetical protein